MTTSLIDKVIRIIQSCQTMDQLRVAMRYIEQVSKIETIAPVVAYHLGFAEGRIKTYAAVNELIDSIDSIEGKQ